MKSLGPDLVYFGGMYPEGALLVRQAKSLGLAAKWLGPDGLYVPAFIDLAGENAEGVYCTFVGTDVGRINTARDFLKAYTARFGQIGPYGAYAYDAANIIINAIRLAGKSDRAAVLAEVRRTKDFPGIAGKIGFDAHGDTTLRLIGVFQVKSRRFVYVGQAKK